LRFVGRLGLIRREHQETARFPGEPSRRSHQPTPALRLTHRASSCPISRPSQRSCV